MKVRGKITAVVGPNEAGKSTLLRGLASMSTPDPFTDGPGGDVPRRSTVRPHDVALKVVFILEPEDHQSISSIESDEKPEKLTLTKTYEGKMAYDVEPRGRRPRAHRRRALESIARLQSRIEPLDDDASDRAKQSADAFEALAAAAQSALNDAADPETISQDGLARIADLSGALDELVPDTAGEVETVKAVLDSVIQSEQAAHPSELIGAELSKRIPLFALFGTLDRDLAYEYNLEGMTADSLPPALRNLAISAGLNVENLLRDIAAQKWDAVAEHIDDANDALGILFEAAWTAGSGTAKVYLQRDGTTLRILVTSKVGRYSPISERSDGLRMFVALTSFIRARTGGGRPVVLLIDEAENHLHYDAQADLMVVLARQELAGQVIYTTHSAGCLPDELGGTIVAVVPDRGSGFSSIDSTYWTGGLGFTPLMMAMGAGAAAITPSRYAILAEGHSEALILPRLIREATGLRRLGYQIAAGIAEAGRADIPALDAEAAHVAYLVDGDSGGKENANKLTKSGISIDRVVHLGGEGSGLCLESLIQGSIYAECAEEASAGTKRTPSKADVAARLIDVEKEIVEPKMIETLAELHVLLSDALQIPEDHRPQLTSA